MLGAAATCFAAVNRTEGEIGETGVAAKASSDWTQPDLP